MTSPTPINSDRDFQMATFGMAIDLLREADEAVKQHPDTEALVRYQEGDLESASERERIRLHLATCVDCREEIETLRQFDLAVTEENESSPDTASTEAAWRSYRLRLDEELPPATEERTQAHVLVGDFPQDRGTTSSSSASGGAWQSRHGWSLVAALLLISCLTYIGYLVFRQPAESGLQVAQADFRNPFLFDLAPDGEQVKRSVGGRDVALPAGTDLMIVRLLLGNTTPYDHYSLRIMNSRGAVAMEDDAVTRQPDGRFVVLVPIEGMPPDSYRVHLAAIGPNGPEELATYSFEIDSTPNQ